MADSKPEKVEAAEYEPQSDEKREEVLRRAAPGGQTATGIARREHFEDVEEPENRGSELEIAGGEPEPTSSNKKSANKPRGLQKEEAQYVANGTVPSGMVASPTGPVPVSAVSARADAAERRMEQEKARTDAEQEAKLKSYDPLTEDQIANMRPGELRAIGVDRGYAIPPGGARAVRRKFAEAQANDPLFAEETPEEEEDRDPGNEAGSQE